MTPGNRWPSKGTLPLQRGAAILGLLAVAALLCSCVTRDGEDSLFGDPASFCGETAVPRSAVPVPPEFEIEQTISVEPFGCGASYTREAAVRGPSDSHAELLNRYVKSLADDGWRTTPCAVKGRICLDNGDHFVAIETRSNGSDPGFSGEIELRSADLLLVVEESADK